MKRTHFHRCQVCGTPTECPGEWEQNFDPDGVYCPEFDTAIGPDLDFRCDDCEALTDEEREAKREAVE